MIKLGLNLGRAQNRMNNWMMEIIYFQKREHRQMWQIIGGQGEDEKRVKYEDLLC